MRWFCDRGVGIYQIKKIGQEIEFIAQADVPLSEAIGHVTAHRLEQSLLIERLLRLSGRSDPANSSRISEAEGRFVYLSGKIQDEFTEAEATALRAQKMSSSETQAAEFAAMLKTLKQVDDEHGSYQKTALEALSLAKAGDVDRAEAMLAEVDETHLAFDRELEDLLFPVQRLADEAAKAAVVHEKDAIRLTVMISLGAGAFSFLLASWLGRLTIVGPLVKVVNALHGLSRNERETEKLATRNDEIGDIGKAFQAFKEHLAAAQKQEHEEQQRQVALTREIWLLSELNEWLQSSSSLDELFSMVSRFMTQLLPTSTGALYVYSNSRDVLDGACAWNGGQLEAHIRPDSCWGLRRGRPYVYGESEVNFACEHGRSCEDDDVYICLPILAHGETVGLLHLTPAEGVAVEEFLEHRKLAQMAAEQVSLAIANTRMRDELHNQSIRDPLTGLYNRRHFIEALRSSLERSKHSGQPVSLVSIDVDHFKLFNDNHGHDAGDMVLRAVGAVLEQSCNGNELPCRLGGEEFMVLLPENSADSAVSTAEALRAAVEKVSVRYGEKNLPKITISCGVASYPSHGMMPQDLMKAADDALYQSKDNGRNRVTVAASADDDGAADMAVMLGDSLIDTARTGAEEGNSTGAKDAA